MKRAWNYWATVGPGGTGPSHRITLQLIGVLAALAPHNVDAFELQPEETLGALMARLGIREEQVMLAFVDGRLATLETLIPDKATVTLCPCISGE